MSFSNFEVPYPIDGNYQTKAVYFSMEFAVEQPLKIYSGGLGFLAGSHLRSAYQLKQNLIGIGILWKYGYYDQTRNPDQTMRTEWVEKNDEFLEDTGIKFQISIHDAPVWVKVWYLNPTTFGSAPLFLLSTDVPENDYISQTITHRLYDANVSTKIAQFILLGIGGAKLVDLLGFNPDVYHFNEAHGISAVFYLLKHKYHSVEKLREHLVFTTHTPEEAGNEKHDIYLCAKMGYFDELSMDEVRKLTGITDDLLNHSLVALRFARRANAVSQLHGKVSNEMWSKYENICKIVAITNAQNFPYWADEPLYNALDKANDAALSERKKQIKKDAFKIVADQTGRIFDPNVLTIVWARRFAGYKRADFLTKDPVRFEKMLANTKYPVQIIWAGKPYPLDFPAISQFNELVWLNKKNKNVSVMVGYELHLSRQLKQAADLWLNNPRVPREASGTSGMTAAMNGAINFSTDDGWIPEFAKPNINSFVIPKADYAKMTTEEQDAYDLNQLYDMLENIIIPMYYENPKQWLAITKNGMQDVRHAFDSKRMAEEYYQQLYNAK